MRTETPETFPPVDSLWYGCQDVQSVNYDWSRDVEAWQSWETSWVECDGGSVECDQCDGGDVDQHDGTTIPCTVCDGNGNRACDFEGEVVCSRLGDWTCPKCDEDHESDGAEGPMMSYYYPLPEHGSFSSEDAAKLEGLPLCLVHFEKWGENYDESLPDWALALTGGGMDLSWQICEAFMRLGYMPPLNFCDLPRMASMDYDSPRNRWVIDGCKRAAEAVRNDAQRTLDKLEALKGKE